MPDWVASERAKYNRIWSEKGGAYGASSPEEIFLMSRIPPAELDDLSRWLIVGGGSGKGFRRLQAMGINPCVVDISDAVACRYPAGAFTCTPAHSMPYEDDSFDNVLCIDVIEHVPPDFVVPSLMEMKRVCSGMMWVQARCAPSVFEPDLHLTVRNHTWWCQTFESIGECVWTYRDNLDEGAGIRCREGIQ